MKERKMKDTELAALAGVSAAYVSKLRNGKSNPSFPALSAISRALGVGIGYFDQEPEIDRELRTFLQERGMKDKSVFQILCLTPATKEDLLRALKSLADL